MVVSQCVAKIKHNSPTCKSTSGKSVQVWLNEDEGGKRYYSGFCFACGCSVPNPYGDNPPNPEEIHVKTPEEIQKELDEITSCKVFDLDHRSIEPEYWQAARVRLLYSEYDGVTPYALAHGYTKNGKLARWKIKLLNKKVMWSVGDTKDNDPYGWEQAKMCGGSTLYITEGEEDSIALRQIMKTMALGTEYAALDYSVISLTDGSDSVHKSLAHVAEEIKQRWQKVVIVFDNDEPGKKAAKEAARLLPGAMIAQLPANDANECLKRGLLKATRDAVVFRAARPLPTALVNKEMLMLELDEEVPMGVSTPWPKLTDMFYGQRRGEIITLGGSEGGGKTTVARQLNEHNIIEHDWGVFTAYMEETPAETIRRMASLHDNLPYFNPNFKDDPRYDEEKFRATCRKFLPNMEIWDRKQQGEDPYETWEGIKTILRQIGPDIDMFILDNLTILSEGISASEKNDFLGKLYADQVKLADQYQFMILDLSHLNPVAKGQRPHEDGGRIKKGDFTGSRAASKYSHAMFGFERNSQAVDPNCSIMRSIKGRASGKTEAFKTYYEAESGRIIQRHWEDSLFETKEIVTLTKKSGPHQ
ncbi:putative DNA primase/helicase [Pectobacterium phage PP101]|uniref:Putative DNA primase/helicase n=1 Tax=Pectobacterium phage PP101 TaxID=1916414 RepID=A0A1J0MEZ5_9CAUD|nr:DNA primase/helicase [Pectobacterium phage PP101]APD19743.1 putative DNA primase/helicase [Pectobacterium phage PP101]